MVMLMAALLCVFAAGPAAAETRSLKLYFLHTKERATITYKKNGRYLPGGLKKLNRFLRDWRRNEPTKMDPRLFDLLWEVYKASGSRKHIHVVSAYRSPQTNAMLRRRSKGVASKSQHMLGRAMDFYLPDVSLKKLRRIGMQAQVGGVGYYPRSGSPFVHLDVGSVRSWPRMGRKELVRVFPKGKTLHLPKDGKPLPGYKQALADYKKRVSSKAIQIAGKRSSGGGNRLASLFTRNNDKQEDVPARTKRPVPEVAATPELELAFIPTPQARPVPPDAGVQLASLVTQDVPGEVALAPSVATQAAAIPESGGIPVTVDTSTLVAAGTGELTQNTDRFGASGRGTQQGLESGTRVTLASAQPSVTAGSFLLAPANVQPADAGLTVASAEPATYSPETRLTDDAGSQLAFVPRPALRPNGSSQEAQVLMAAFDPQSGAETIGEPAVGIPIPTPSPFGSLRGEGEMVSLSPVLVALAPQSANTPRAQGILESAFAPMLRSQNGKGGRPNASDAAETRRGSLRKEPVLTQNLATRRTFAANRIAAMQGPAKAPHFVSSYMRRAPDTVHMDGFSPENRVASADQFSGRAVNFMTVARFVVRN
jgi:uncharacterized protein YcbK (DUF882 family)